MSQPTPFLMLFHVGSTWFRVQRSQRITRDGYLWSVEEEACWPAYYEAHLTQDEVVQRIIQCVTKSA